jgi:hypothetical protein
MQNFINKFFIYTSIFFLFVHGASAFQGGVVFKNDIPEGAKSENSTAKSKLQIVNSTKKYLDFRWINFDGDLELIRPKSDWGHSSIGPGNKWGQNTYTNHIFVIIDTLNSKVLGCFFLKKQGVYNLKFQESGTGFELIQE